MTVAFGPHSGPDSLSILDLDVKPKEVVPDLYQIRLGSFSRGPVNAYLIRCNGKLTLIDTGYADDAQNILTVVRELGHEPTDISNILVTHAHYDHAGGLAALKEATSAPAWMHPLDAQLVRAGCAARRQQPTPGLINRMLCRVYVRGHFDFVPPAEIEHTLEDGQEIPVAGGLRGIHIPGHCAGQVAFHWPKHGGVLFAGDAAYHSMGLRLQPTHENFKQGRESLRKLAEHHFEVAVFGHGKPITLGAAEAFRKAFGRTNASAV